MLGFPVSIHDLRGSHATMLLDAGEKPHVVAARLPEEPSGMSAMLRVNCPKCGRDGRYLLSRLIEKHGRDAKLIDWLNELTVDCPKKIAHNMNDPWTVPFRWVFGEPAFLGRPSSLADLLQNQRHDR